jgi:hypothetical protein
MKTTNKIKIYLDGGKCPSIESFCDQAGRLLGQSSDKVNFALSFILEEQGKVEAMETYCNICGIIAY